MKANTPRRARTRGRILCLAALLLSALPAVADERLPIRTYTTADGLAHNNVKRIVRDSRGFLWFCTADGLSRFDGYTFVNFGTDDGLPHPRVNDLLETREGHYWLATDGGLVRFDPRGRPGSGIVYEGVANAAHPMFTVLLPEADLPGARAVTVLFEAHDGAIWAGTENGLHRLKGTTGHRSLEFVDVGIPRVYPDERLVSDLLEDSSGTLWIGASSGLYRRFADGTAVRYTRRDGLPGDSLADLFEDHEGRLWAGARVGGFFRIRSGGTPAASLAVDAAFNSPELPTSWVFRIFESSDRRFWVASARGLIEYFPHGDGRGQRFHAYSVRNGLSYYDITDLAEDLGGNLWLATNRAGAMKLARNGITTYGERDSIAQVSDIFQDHAGALCFRGTLMTGPRERSQKGDYVHRLGCFDGREFTWFRAAAITVDGWVTEAITVQTDDGEWWLGTGTGVFRFPASDRFTQLQSARPRAVYTMARPVSERQVYRLFNDSRGNVWISINSSTVHGLGLWEHGSARVRDLANSPGLPTLAGDLPRAFAEDHDGNIWIGFDTGVARYTRGRFSFFGRPQGFTPGAILDIHVDRAGRIWLASARGGVVRVRDPNAARPAFEALTTAQGLSSNNTEVITEDNDGHIYIGGGRGLDRLDPETGRLKRFTTADGLLAGTFRAAFRDAQGVLWFGMSSGLARLAPLPEKPATPPVAMIHAVRVTGLPQPVSALGEVAMSLPDLRNRQNQLEVEFGGLAFGAGEVLRYQYWLEGTNDSWSAPTEQRTVTYASLSPGRYQFRVQAVDSEGVASAQAAVLTFRILPPIWLRWWFLALAALAGGVIVRAVHRYRVARLLEMANMRTRIATDLHDDIGANLTRIALLSEVARQAHHDEGRGHLASIARIARESVGSMSDIVWAINPARDTLLDLTRRMRQHAEEIFTLREIQLRFTAPSERESLKLGVDVRRELLLIFKEAVSNVARHSGCSEVAIDLRIEGPRLVLSVRDNGAGFDKSVASEGQGLMSMQRRAQRLGGTLDIRMATPSGTAVRLELPL
ncbi:MAG: hypothetical protein H0W08_24300 [Acidobacteria bacterium]|nr:hypothetical protein [Acidobacteriota bacterium]